jgi:hypothetical protein
MKLPAASGTAISPERINSWVERFRFYRHPPDQAAIMVWLDRFSPPDRDLAARMLDVVELKSEIEIQRGYLEALEGIEGWDIDAGKREGQWLFVGFGNAGESGQSMLRIFREATGMASEKYQGLFCSSVELVRKNLTAKDTLVFIDDFSGTGQQITKHWPVLAELIASEARCHLLLTAATDHAIKKIKSETELRLHVSFVLNQTDNIFHDSCDRFSKKEKKSVEKYCKLADRRNPKGWGSCGLLFVLSHKTPNNTIPILHVNTRKWVGLFPRILAPKAA